MTETQQAQAAQAANGQAPIAAAASPQTVELSDTGEKWLGVLVIAAACFLLFVGIDRVTNGALSGRLFYGGEADAGG